MKAHDSGILHLVDWYLEPGSRAGAARLRREIGDYLRRHAADPENVPEAELAVEELLGNAVRHTQGPVWVSIEWPDLAPTVTIADLGDEFDLSTTMPDLLAEGGRGLVLAAHLTDELSRANRRAGGNRVTAKLALQRTPEPSYAPPRRAVDSLPALEEAQEGGGFGRESFLRALVVQLATAVERDQGPAAAEAAVAQVGTDVGGQMEEEYRLAREITGRLSPEQLADCYIRLKHAIEGDFYLIEVTPQRIILGNRQCPFGDAVQRAPSLCRMTSSVFGGIGARNAEGALVTLEERIAVGDPECRVVVELAPIEPERRTAGHYYPPPREGD